MHWLSGRCDLYKSAEFAAVLEVLADIPYLDTETADRLCFSGRDVGLRVPSTEGCQNLISATKPRRGTGTSNDRVRPISDRFSARKLPLSC
jgi:hypothetical protein